MNAKLRTALADEAGFTLIEVLAAMAIFFMAIGILISGTAQALRLAEIERSEAVASRSTAMRLGWFREQVAQTYIPAEDRVTPFKADARQMSGTSGLSLAGIAGGPGPYSWRLAYNPQRGETEIQVDRAELQLDRRAAVRVFSWPGDSGRFLYMDEAGDWQDQWPPFGLNPGKLGVPGYNLLPVAVMLEYGADRRVLVAAVQDRSLPPPSMKEMLK